MKNRFRLVQMTGMVIITTAILTGCFEQTEIQKQQDTKVENAIKVMGETKVPVINKSLERENIRQRILVSNDPNTLQWIYPMSAGRVIGRVPVKGKVTSGSKRLTASEGYSTSISSMQELPDEMATYGSSGEYIFWFDPAGRIHQHKGDYFISTVPYKLEQGYGTISTEIDQAEDVKRSQYEKEMVEANKKMEDISNKGGQN